MTIACCLVIPEGVVFASDSTVSEGSDGRYHYLNHNQKIFEFGENSTLGAMTWGLSALGTTAHRTIVARTADQFAEKPPETVREAAQTFASNIWVEFQRQFAGEMKEYREIRERVRELARLEADERSAEDDSRLTFLQNEISAGFCVGGHCGPERKPQAFWFEIDPTLQSPPVLYEVIGDLIKGQEEYFHRLYDPYGQVRNKILESGYWHGGSEDLDNIFADEYLSLPELNIRDAIDFANFIVYSTIKIIKFSNRDQVCGGPIEIAAITSDRNFRWVRHKLWDAAIEA